MKMWVNVMFTLSVLMTWVTVHRRSKTGCQMSCDPRHVTRSAMYVSRLLAVVIVPTEAWRTCGVTCTSTCIYYANRWLASSTERLTGPRCDRQAYTCLVSTDVRCCPSVAAGLSALITLPPRPPPPPHIPHFSIHLSVVRFRQLNVQVS